MVRDEEKDQAVAEIDRVDAGYDGATVLKDLSVHLQTGRISALAGPNGAGKSTFIRLLTGTLAPRKGTVSCNPRDISLVPQEIALYAWLTAEENCVAFAMMDGISRREATRRAHIALNLTGCEAISSRRVAALSGGYRRRVNIAAALMSAPRLVILDEPTAGLDAEAKRVVQDVMVTIRRSGCGVLIVTHDFDVVEHIADRVLVMSDGRLLRDLPPEDLVLSVCGNRRPIEFILADTPDESHITEVIALGGISYSATRWVFLESRVGPDLGSVRGALEMLGLRIAETRMREPNLADAYSILTKSEALSS
ncbi:MAG: ABC transporter ATP-binding protein [Hyphomicrobiales bacterium]|nr:ABC transporter ATP-binding protein [Hyphomicrobiales bacterium]